MNVFKLPDLGEGLQEADIVEWHIKVGDKIKVDDPLVSMETAKAVVEVPSPMEGRIAKLHGKQGDTILTGASLVEFELENAAENIKFPTKDATKAATKVATKDNKDKALQAKKAANIANEILSNIEINLDKKQQSKNQTQKRKDTGTVAGVIEETGEILEEDVVTITKQKTNIAAKAMPAVRELAQKLKVNIDNIFPSGPNGIITVQDILNASKKNKVVENADGYEPLKGVRKSMARAMILSHSEVVPVCVSDDAKLINWKQKEDITIRLIRAIVAGCKEVPEINSWFNGKKLSRKIIKEINLGMAMDLGDGLFVPVMKDVANKSDQELRSELNRIKVQVKERTIPQEDLNGATFTLSNFGKFAGRYANPIIVPPQVAILGAGAIREEVVAINGEIKISKVMPLALTFDHRSLTGGEATRFLGALMENLEK